VVIRTLDADGLVQNLGEGRQAVGGAGRVRDDQVIGGQLVVVHAEHDGQIDLLGRSRDQHALGARRQMLAGALAVHEEAGAFQRNVDALAACGRLAGSFSAVTWMRLPLMTRSVPSTSTVPGRCRARCRA
jgi:hypothetical protein